MIFHFKITIVFTILVLIAAGISYAGNSKFCDPKEREKVHLYMGEEVALGEIVSFAPEDGTFLVIMFSHHYKKPTPDYLPLVFSPSRKCLIGVLGNEVKRFKFKGEEFSVVAGTTVKEIFKPRYSTD